MLKSIKPLSRVREHGLNPIQIYKASISFQKGNDIFVYWDLDATPNDKGSQWRKATNPMRVRI